METVKIKKIYFDYVEDSEIKVEETRNMSRKYSFTEKTMDLVRKIDGEVVSENESSHSGVISVSFDMDKDIEEQQKAQLLNTSLPTVEVYLNNESIGFGTN
jgi:hypothetical protein